MKEKGRRIGGLILRTLLLWCGVCILLTLADRRFVSNAHKDAEGYLQGMQDKDIQVVSDIVHKADKKIKLAQVDSIEEELRIRFSDAVFLGDSIIEGILDYGLLQEDHVVAMRGRRTDNCEEDIAIVKDLAPRQLFMLYGMNDLAFCRGDAQRFREQYQELLSMVMTSLPNTDIYVLAILPIQETAIQETAVYANYKEFNLVLQKLCEENKLPFIDAGHLLTSPEDYEFDGIHPKYDFYPLWLLEIAKEAGL